MRESETDGVRLEREDRQRDRGSVMQSARKTERMLEC